MTRPSEASGFRWEEVDLDEKVWTIPAERMKKLKEHRIPLTQKMLELLEVIKPISGHREFIFPQIETQRNHVTVKRLIWL